MLDEEELLKTLLPEKVLESAYQDMASSPAKEAGKLFSDIVKTARLFLAPLQVAAAFQDRFERIIQRISDRVPEERRIEAPAEVIGPALEQMRYLQEDNPLWSMFEELLSRSVDTIEINSIHPSFAHIIKQLSRDEAVILYLLKDVDFEVVDVLDLNSQEKRFENRRIEKSNLPTDALLLPQELELYYFHLESLNLVSWPVYKQDPIFNEQGVQIGVRRQSRMLLTEFGRLFVNACIPGKGFKV